MMGESADESPLYHIEEVAEQTGLTKRTLRYYEEIGLLNPLARTEGNYRLYTTADVARIKRILQIRDALGLSLADINNYLRVEDERDQIRASFMQEKDTQVRHDQLERARVLTREQLAIVEAKLLTLNDLRDQLLTRLANYDAVERDLD